VDLQRCRSGVTAWRQLEARVHNCHRFAIMPAAFSSPSNAPVQRGFSAATTPREVAPGLTGRQDSNSSRFRCNHGEKLTMNAPEQLQQARAVAITWPVAVRPSRRTRRVVNAPSGGKLRPKVRTIVPYRARCLPVTSYNPFSASALGQTTP
jgi:hypothetical protein